MTSESLREKIRAFKCDGAAAIENKLSKVAKLKRPRAQPKLSSDRHKVASKYADLNDLPPSIPQEATLLFVGYNPGVESSKKQHHYAHPTNLFWKLFNESAVVESVLGVREKEEDKFSKLYKEIFATGICKAKPCHDYELLQFGIGFTDLCLRCTKQASELTMQEKLQNVPRLFTEFALSQAPILVLVGKGIWEIIVKFLDPKHKLESPFGWGRQTDPRLLRAFHSLCKYNPSVYVVPNTSGLAALMKYAQKLELWEEIARDIDQLKPGSSIKVNFS